MRFAYADPPYLGCAKRCYGDATYDDLAAHAALIQRLGVEFPDGWAYSLSSASISRIAPLLPDGVRWGAWVKPFCSFKPGVNPAFAWEPVAFMGGRRGDRIRPTVRDWCSANITLKRGLTGAKPAAFAAWLFDLLGMEAGDDLVDLFPGTGAIGAAWAARTEAVA